MAADGKILALVLAAGSGSRAGPGVPKQFREIGGKAVLEHAVEHLRRAGIDDIRVAIGSGQEALYEKAAGHLGLPAPLTGGAERQKTVRSGLEAIANDGGGTDVLIHDAARPFVPGSVVARLLDALASRPAAVPVLGVVDTLAIAGASLGEAVQRDGLVRVQTPQAFRFDPILAAHRAWAGGAATDDAQVARAAGIEVAMVEGDARLEKLTYESDFERAEDRLARGMVGRSGLGFDAHAFGEGGDLWLGGILIPHDRGLRGHSDADVLLHAVTDAILGAIGAGDIGDHFPPSDPRWLGAASASFVEHARTLVEARGGRIAHVDATLICEAPRIGPYREAMRERIAALLRLPLQAVSVKATTTDRLGFTGRGEGIAAQAIATVRLLEDR